jgi:CBS domain-containing protein
MTTGSGACTDRDIAVKGLAEERDASTLRAGELAEGTSHWVAADADLNEVLSVVEEHQVKRLPVIENHRLVA